jgi:hypothetical protein
VHSSVSDVNGSEGEFKLHGRAVRITDPELLHGEYEAWWTAGDASRADVFSMDIASAAYVSWNITNTLMRVMRWSPASGIETLERRY